MVPIVWLTKYRYKILHGDIKKRCHELIIQICDALDIRIMGGVVSGDHIHLHIEYPPRFSISEIVKRLKGRTSRKLQMEYPKLKKKHIGAALMGDRIWCVEYRQYKERNNC